MPEAAVMVFNMLGFCCALVKPFGPVHDQVAVPLEVVLAVRFNVFVLQSGPLLETVGVEGGVGSVNVTGPTVLEIQPATEVTFILE